jgi:hypothetical protein
MFFTSPSDNDIIVNAMMIIEKLGFFVGPIIFGFDLVEMSILKISVL